MNSQTLIQIPDAESVANAKIAAAARLYVAAHTARLDAYGGPHQQAHEEAYDAFYRDAERAHAALLEACAEPGREPWPETIRPDWLQDSPYVLVQGQIYHPATAEPWYVSSDGHLLVALPGLTPCRAGAERLAKVASVLYAPAVAAGRADYAELLSWLVEVCDAPPRPADESPVWPICAPESRHHFDGQKLLHALRELPETSTVAVEVCEIATEGEIGPVLRITATLGSWICCLIGLWANDETRRLYPAQVLPMGRGDRR